MRIRPEKPSDYAAIAAVHTSAFDREEEARLVEQIRDSDRYIPDLSLVAEQDDCITGHVLFSEVDLVAEEITRTVLALAPLAVRPEFQNRGIGSALVQAGLEMAEIRQAPLIVVLGHPQFYLRFGFEPASRFEITASFPVPDEAFMVKALSHYQPECQGKVVYPEAFSEV